SQSQSQLTDNTSTNAFAQQQRHGLVAVVRQRVDEVDRVGGLPAQLLEGSALFCRAASPSSSSVGGSPAGAVTSTPSRRLARSAIVSCTVAPLGRSVGGLMLMPAPT